MKILTEKIPARVEKFGKILSAHFYNGISKIINLCLIFSSKIHHSSAINLRINHTFVTLDSVFPHAMPEIDV